MLEDSGLLVRALDKIDARRRVISLTGRGEEVLRAANETLEREIEALLEVLSEDELDAFFTAFERVGKVAQENA